MNALYSIVTLALLGVAFCPNHLFAQNTYRTNFESQNVGTAYENSQWQQDGFSTASWNSGLAERTIVDTAYANSGVQSLRVEYPQGGVGPSETGCQIPLQFQPQDEMYMSYRIRFSGNFTWGTTSYGGKLPGLAGGNNCSGGDDCSSGAEGFTARFMWRTGGKAVLYLYHMDKPDVYGENIDLLWPNGDAVVFEREKWYHIQERVRINSTGTDYDGEVQVWINGKEVLLRSGLRFTSNGDKIDNLYISTFHGGSDDTWAPEETCHIWLDDVTISPSFDSTCYVSCQMPNLGSDISLCNSPGYVLETGLDSHTSSITWLKNGQYFTQGTPLQITEPGQYVLLYDSAGCHRKDTVIAYDGIVADLGSDREICAHSKEVLSANCRGNVLEYQWFRDGVLLGGENASTLNTSVAGEYSVSISADGCSSVTDTVLISSGLLQLSQIPKAGEEDLAIISVNEYGNNFGWFTAAEGGKPIAVGKTFATDNFDLYVQDLDGFSGSVGKKRLTDAWTDDRFDRMMKFQVFRSLMIDSVTVFPVEEEDVTISILASDGTTVVCTKTFTGVPAGKARLALQFPLIAGEYYMSAQGTTGKLQHSYDADTTINFPYTVDGLLSISGSNLAWIDAKPYYLFFYDWHISAGNACARTPVSTADTSAIRSQERAFSSEFASKYYQFTGQADTVAEPIENADVVVSIDPEIILGKIPTSLFGNNLAHYMNKNCLTNDTKKRHFKNASHTLIRWPGGNGSNQYFWDGTIPAAFKEDPKLTNPVSGTDGAWRLTNDQYLQMLDTLGAGGTVCINASYAFYGTGQNPVADAASYAAQWVRYFNGEKQAGIKYWEIGNENYGPWQAGYEVDGVVTTGEDYGRVFRTIADSMKQADSTIFVGAVIFPDENRYDNWTAQVLPEVEDHADYLIIHEYFHPDANRNEISESEIYQSIEKIAEDKAVVEAIVEKYTTKPAGYFPIAMTEYNARSGTREISRTNAIFITQCLAEFAKNGYDAAYMWDMQNGFQTEEGGDHGMISHNDPKLPEFSAYPSLYAHHYFNRYMGTSMIHCQSDNDDIRSYATVFDSGEIGFVLLNTSANDHVVQLSSPVIQQADQLWYHTITGDSDMDRTVYINGIGPEGGSDGVSGPQNYEGIPSRYYQLGDDRKLSLPAYSVSYALIKPRKITQIIFCNAEWNLVSLFLQPEDNSAGSVFPGASVVKNQDFHMQTNRVDYSNLLDTIAAGKAYWVYYSTPTDITVVGEKVTQKVTQLHSGWNFIGIPVSKEIDVESLPSEVTGVKDLEQFYIPSSATGELRFLQPGKGYYLYANTDCQIIW